MLELKYWYGFSVFHLPSLCPRIFQMKFHGFRDFKKIQNIKNSLLKLYNCEGHNQMELGNSAYPFAQFPFVLIAM